MMDQLVLLANDGYEPVRPLTTDEAQEIVLAIQSAFKIAANIHAEIVPIYEKYGTPPPSKPAIARTVSENAQVSIARHSKTFKAGVKHADLQRDGLPWEVKIKKGTGMTINQCSPPKRGSTYIVANYTASLEVRRVWILWEPTPELFSPRRENANARALNMTRAYSHIQVLFPNFKQRQIAVEQLRLIA